MNKLQARAFAIIFALGAAWRYYFVFTAHPATRFVFSDMYGYHEWAERFFKAGQQQNIADTFHPPGPAIFFGLLYSMDPTWNLAMGAQWLLACGTLLFIYLIAAELYCRTTALAALGLAALYFPFTHYAGYFLAENVFTFFLVVTLWLFTLCLRAPCRCHAILLGLAAGVACGVAASMKNSVLGPAVTLMAGCGVLYARHRAFRFFSVLLGCSLGMLLIFVPMTVRCTQLNEGHFCLASTNTATNILMGHYGKKGLFRWHDVPRHIEIAFGSPTSFLNGWNEPVDLPFGAYDSDQNLALAWRYIASHPWAALDESVCHVVDLFFGRTLWPSADDGPIAWGAWSQRGYWLFVLAPAMGWLAMRARRMASFEWDTQAEWVLLLPTLGIAAGVFISVSEVRYRIPYDAFSLILAAQFYVIVWRWVGVKLCHAPGALSGAAPTDLSLSPPAAVTIPPSGDTSMQP